jgi:hypothetical protein
VAPASQLDLEASNHGYGCMADGSKEKKNDVVENYLGKC